MTSCPSCGEPQTCELGEGVVHRCESDECHELYWIFENQSFVVPNLVMDQHSQVQGFSKATTTDECSWFDEHSVLFSRLNQDFSSILFGENEFSAGRLVINESDTNTRMYESLNDVLKKFGLKTTRLSDLEAPRGNDPFIIHRVDHHPLEFSNSITVSPFLNAQVVAQLDPRWVDWEPRLMDGLNNIGITLNDQMLKPQQNEALISMLKTPTSLTIGALPTGFGKSRIMQVAANLLNHGHTDGLNNGQGSSGPVLIISPLISLRDDQRSKWEEYNESLKEGISKLRCRFLTSTNPERDDDVLRDLKRGEVDVLCCSPDLLLNLSVRGNKWLECFQTMERPISALMIDEAHVIGDWGASIIPTFQLLPTIKNQLLFRNRDLRVLLLSATISVEEEAELITLFQEGLHLPNRRNESYAIRHSKARLGLVFDVESPVSKDEDDDSFDDRIIQEMRQKKSQIPPRWQYKSDNSSFFTGAGPPAILYTYRKEKANQLRNRLRGLGYTAKEYIGSSGSFHRKDVLHEFKQNQLQWVVGTSAFGMGVDKDDVWVVGYLGIPSSLKELYQSFGRAARFDDWGFNEHRKNGYCKGILIGKQQPFKPKMKLPLTMERIMRAFLHPATQSVGNGYMILDIESIREKVWSTDGLENAAEEIDETEGLADEFGLHQLHQSMVGEQQRALRDEALRTSFENSIKEARSRSRSLQENSNLFLWALACAQRSGFLEVCGIHPRVLYTTQEGEYRLLDALENEAGYGQVMEDLRMQRSRKGRTPSNQKRFVVVRFKKTDDLTYDSLHEHVRLGHLELKDRYERGLHEFREFRQEVRKGTTCMRKLFAICYGSTSESTLSCLEHLKKHEAAMPCNVCMNALARGENPVDHIWSEPTHFHSLFKLEWPQKPARNLVLFDKPVSANQCVNLEQAHPATRYIFGEFRLHADVSSVVFSEDIPLLSDNSNVGYIQCGNTGIATVIVDGDNPIPWTFNGRNAYRVLLLDGVAKIDWVE